MSGKKTLVPAAPSHSFYQRYGKRLLDITSGVVALPVIAAATLVVGVAIKLDDAGPVFYKQTRRGMGGKDFHMLKFRSMHVNAPDIRRADNSTLASVNDARVTRVGRIIRKTSIDEIPQLINVLKGDMSLIGPRPNLVTRPLSALSDIELRRIAVRPGITGYNQAYYRNSSTLDERYAHDCYYAENISFAMDLRIVGATISSVVRGRNIYTTDSPACASDTAEKN